MSATDKLREELQVKFVDIPIAKEKINTTVSNPKLKIYREFVLATLSAFIKTRKAEQSRSCTETVLDDVEANRQPQIYALDAMAESGLAGLQWKKHLGADVHVALAESKDTAVLSGNAEHNSLTTCQTSLDSRRVPGDPCCYQDSDTVHIFPVDAKPLLMTEAFNFVYLYAWKNCVTYFDSACHSVKHGGLLCVVISDTSVFARSPHVVKRWYAADFLKTEYHREMVARTVLANIARSAGRYNKAIQPQYVLAVDDFLLVCVRFSKGHKASETSVRQICPVLHCRVCEERKFLPQQMAPFEDPYSLLPCDCQAKTPGKTAVILGPMWKGPIFSNSFLHKLEEEGKSIKLSPKFTSLLSLLISESSGKDDLLNGDKPTTNKLVNDQSCDTILSSNLKRKAENRTDQDVSPKKAKICDNLTNQTLDDTRNIPFFQHVNKLKRVTVPKLDKLVSILRREGFEASRSHFDPYSIRTTANVAEFTSSLRKHCSV